MANLLFLETGIPDIGIDVQARAALCLLLGDDGRLWVRRRADQDCVRFARPPHGGTGSRRLVGRVSSRDVRSSLEAASTTTVVRRPLGKIARAVLLKTRRR